MHVEPDRTVDLMVASQQKRPSIALIRPLHSGDEGEFQEPLGIECVAGYLEEHGYAVHIFDRRLFEAEGDTPAFWAEFTKTTRLVGGFSLVGLSVMTAGDAPDALRIIQRIWASCSEVAFVVGGLYVTTAHQHARTVFPDAVELIRGEGEVPLLALARRLDSEFSTYSDAETAQRDSSFSEEDSRDQDSTCRTTATTDTILIFDTVLTPDKWARPSRPNLSRYAARHCAISLRSARGCNGNCTFCATPNLPAPYRRWMARDVRLVVDEIEYLSARAKREGFLPIFNFIEDDFGSLERVEELDNELRARDLRIAYSLQMRGARLIRQTLPLSHLRERLQHLREGGFTRLFIGLESVNQETLTRWNKPLDVSMMLDVLDAFKHAGIQTHIGYILWHAHSTPGSVREEAKTLHDHDLFTAKCALARMIRFPGSAQSLKEEATPVDTVFSAGHSQAHWEPLTNECEQLYARLESHLDPLFRVWARGATLLPYAAAQAHLEDSPEQVEAIERIMSACDEVAYRAVVEDSFEEDPDALASDLGGEFDAVCRTHFSP
jgi:radical SAM superfamily enzyme YgiQ (UPF0313 family)